MKKKINFIFISLLTTLSFSCQRNNIDIKDNLIVIDMNKDYPTLALQLSDIASVSFIKLKDEDSVLLSHPIIRDLYIDNDYLYINDFSPSFFESKLYLYDIRGNYIKRIGKQGRGPGEISGRFSTIVHPQTKDIFLYSPTNKKLVKFDSKGNYISSNYTEFSYTDGAIIDDQIILFNHMSEFISNNRIYSEETISKFDCTTLQKTDSINIRFPNIYVTEMRGITAPLTYTNNGIYISTFCADTVYHVSKDITPRIVHVNTPNDIYNHFMPLIETDKYILFSNQPDMYSLTREKVYIKNYIYYKNEKKIYQIDSKDIKNKDFNYKLLSNEIALNETNKTRNHQFLASLIPIELLKNQYYKILPADLKYIVDNASLYEDNPILMLMEFK